MKKRLLSLTLAALTAASLAGCGSSSSTTTESTTTESTTTTTESTTTEAASTDDGTVYKFMFASENVSTHPRNIAMTEFFEVELEERSGGRIEVDIYTDGVLGSESELIQMLPTNAIQGYRGGGYDALNPAFDIWSAPFAFTTYDEVSYFQTTDLAKEIMNDISDPNIYVPATGFTGFRQIVCKEAITVPSDLSGLLMRAPNQNPVLDFYTACGASPQNMGAADAYMGLQQGAIEGVCNPFASIDAFNYLDGADYLIEISYNVGPDPFMVNATWYNSLPDDLKVIFDEVCVETMVYSDDLVAADDNVSKEICMAAAKEYINIIEDDALVDQWREATISVSEKAIERGSYTQAQYDELVSLMEAYRA